MTFETVYYISQTFAVAAILASLVFLGLQTRQQVRISRAEVARDADDYWGNVLAPLREDPEFARLVRVALIHWDKLSNNQKLILNAFWLDMPMSLTNVSVIREAKLISPWQESVRVNFLLGLLGTSGGLSWWEDAKFAVPTEVRDMVDTRLADTSSLPPPWTLYPPFQSNDDDLAILLAQEAALVAEAHLILSPKSEADDVQDSD